MTKGSKENRVKPIFHVLALLVWVGTAVIVSQLVVGYTMILFLGRGIFSKPMLTAVFSALSYIVAMILIIFVPPKILARAKKGKLKTLGKTTQKTTDNTRVINRKEIGLEGTPTWTDIGLAPVGYFVYLLLAAALTVLFSVFPWFDAKQAQDVGFSTFLTGTDRVIAFIVLVVVAPVVEEIIFRGWLYAKIREQTSIIVGKYTSIVLTSFLVSLLFGIVHMQWNVGVNVFALSVVMCALREVTDTIYAGILLHMLKNGIAFYLLYVVGL